jgi:hypothetical protein
MAICWVNLLLVTPTLPVNAQEIITKNVRSNSGTVDFSRDARLRLEIDFKVKWGSIGEVTKAISEATGANIQVERAVSGRRINLFSFGCSAAQDMVMISRATGLTWNTMPGKNVNEVQYILSLSADRRDQEAQWKLRSEKREKARRIEGQAKMEAALNKASNNDKAAIASLLNQYSAQELSQIADLAQEGINVVSASDQRHLHNFLMFPTPYRNLPGNVQRGVSGLSRGTKYTEQNLLQAANSQKDLEDTFVGLIAANGTVSLGVYNPANHDVWNTPEEQIVSSFPSDEEKMDDFDPRVSVMLDSPRLVTGLPTEIARKRIRFPQSVDRRHLANLLQRVSDTFRLSVATEDYFRTRVASSVLTRDLLPASDEFSVQDALRQIARTFGYQMIFQNGVLYVTTLTPGADLRAEPPVELIERMAQIDPTKNPVSFELYKEIASLSKPQIETLVLRQPANLSRLWNVLWQVQRIYPILHLYVGLRPEQQQVAETTDGLPLSSLDSRLQREFQTLARRGLPIDVVSSKISKEERVSDRLYVYREPGSQANDEKIVFSVTPKRRRQSSLEVTVQGTAFSLEITRPLPLP